jgi:hypothetical protein
MSTAAIDQLERAVNGLRQAFDGNDPAAIDAASARLTAAAGEARAVGAWRADPVLKARLKALLPELESARVRANVLADHSRRQMALLADRGASGAPLTYGR